MKPLEITVAVYENRINEAQVKDLMKPVTITKKEDSTIKRMAKRINRGASQRGFAHDGEECVSL